LLCLGGAPATDEGLAEVALTFARVEHPGPILPRRLMTQVLRMAAGQLGDPVAVLVPVETQQADGPSVRPAVAFGRYGG
jgi:hypothetical protein